MKKVKVYQINNDDGSGRVRLMTWRTERTIDAFDILYASCRLRDESLLFVNQGVSASILNVINENNTREENCSLNVQKDAMMRENFLVDWARKYEVIKFCDDHTHGGAALL